MAFIATIKILVDAATENEVYDGLNALFRNEQGALEDQEPGMVVDWMYDRITPVSASLDDAICNETYSEGGAFIDNATQHSDCMEMLTIATAAVRDLHVGFPDSEIAAKSGLGLATLVKDLVRFCREQGIDDQDGWDCAITQDIPVVAATSPHPVAAGEHVPEGMQPFTLVIEAYATNYFVDAPSYAEITVNPAFIAELLRLQQVCIERRLESVSIGAGPDRWNKDALQIRGDSLHVWHGRSFRFVARPLLADYDVETRSIAIDALLRLASAGPKKELLEDNFRWSGNRLFYAINAHTLRAITNEVESLEEISAQMQAKAD